MRKRNLLNEINETLEVFGKFSNLNEGVNFAENYNGEYDNIDDTPEAEDVPEKLAADAPVQSSPESSVEPNETSAESNVALKDAPVEKQSSEEAGLEELGSEVDQIREIALRGLVKLCRTPENPAYDALKKIFQFCDKANEKKEEPVK